MPDVRFLGRDISGRAEAVVGGQATPRLVEDAFVPPGGEEVDVVASVTPTAAVPTIDASGARTGPVLLSAGSVVSSVPPLATSYAIGVSTPSMGGDPEGVAALSRHLEIFLG